VFEVMQGAFAHHAHSAGWPVKRTAHRKGKRKRVRRRIFMGSP
jgi:hypothetical protein